MGESGSRSHALEEWPPRVSRAAHGGGNVFAGNATESTKHAAVEAWVRVGVWRGSEALAFTLVVQLLSLRSAVRHYYGRLIEADCFFRRRTVLILFVVCE